VEAYVQTVTALQQSFVGVDLMLKSLISKEFKKALP